MTLEKAIEILNLAHAGVISIQSKDYQDAVKLGTEALTRIKNCREHDAAFVELPLPGETKEEELKRR